MRLGSLHFFADAAALSLLLPAAALAGKGSDRGRRDTERIRPPHSTTAREERHHLDMRFRGLDRNNDGAITRSEWRGSETSFRNQDRNRDSVLSGDEVRVGYMRAPVPLPFDRLDRDANGSITRLEWPHGPASFDRRDRNRDGVLTPERVPLIGRTAGQPRLAGAPAKPRPARAD